MPDSDISVFIAQSNFSVDSMEFHSTHINKRLLSNLTSVFFNQKCEKELIAITDFTWMANQICICSNCPTSVSKKLLNSENSLTSLKRKNSNVTIFDFVWFHNDQNGKSFFSFVHVFLKKSLIVNVKSSSVWCSRCLFRNWQADLNIF